MAPLPGCEESPNLSTQAPGKLTMGSAMDSPTPRVATTWSENQYLALSAELDDMEKLKQENVALLAKIARLEAGHEAQTRSIRCVQQINQDQTVMIKSLSNKIEYLENCLYSACIHGKEAADRLINAKDSFKKRFEAMQRERRATRRRANEKARERDEAIAKLEDVKLDCLNQKKCKNIALAALRRATGKIEKPDSGFPSIEAMRLFDKSVKVQREAKIKDSVIRKFTHQLQNQGEHVNDLSKLLDKFDTKLVENLWHFIQLKKQNPEFEN